MFACNQPLKTLTWLLTNQIFIAHFPPVSWSGCKVVAAAQSDLLLNETEVWVVHHMQLIEMSEFVRQMHWHMQFFCMPWQNFVPKSLFTRLPSKVDRWHACAHYLRISIKALESCTQNAIDDCSAWYLDLPHMPLISCKSNQFLLIKSDNLMQCVRMLPTRWVAGNRIDRYCDTAQQFINIRLKCCSFPRNTANAFARNEWMGEKANKPWQAASSRGAKRCNRIDFAFTNGSLLALWIRQKHVLLFSKISCEPKCHRVSWLNFAMHCIKSDEEN